MHVGDILLQLLRCTSGHVAGPQVGWDMVDYSLAEVPVEKKERFSFGQRILFIMLFS